MKLLFILSEYLPDSGGGIISYYAGVLPHLVRANHEVQVLVASTAHLDRPSLTLDGVRILYLRSEFLAAANRGFARFRHGFPSFSAFLPVAWAAYHQANCGEGYDLVETTDFPMLYAPWVAEAVTVPVNVSLHGSPGQLDWYEKRGAGSFDADLMRLVERAAFSSAMSLQANSDINASFWKMHTRRKVPVLPPAYSGEALAEAGNEGRCGGLVVGRLQSWKGPRVLCEAMRWLPDLEMLWIGRDVTDPTSNQAFSDSLRREFPDIFGSRLRHQRPMPHGDVRKQIAAAEFLCVPSTWDVFNLTIVEAMEVGTPVICSTAAGASMLISHGENGFLFDPQDPAQLAAAITSLRKLTTGQRSRLVTAAKHTVGARLDPRSLAAERICFYDNLIADHHPALPDPWLKALLSPGEIGGNPGRILNSFTCLQLLKAAGLQLCNGIRRRIYQPNQ